MDLSLVPVEELQDEIIKRCECVVMAYLRHEDAGDPTIYVRHEGLSTLGCLGLCDMARDQIQRSFNKRNDN